MFITTRKYAFLVRLSSDNVFHWIKIGRALLEMIMIDSWETVHSRLKTRSILNAFIIVKLFSLDLPYIYGMSNLNHTH